TRLLTGHTFRDRPGLMQNHSGLLLSQFPVRVLALISMVSLCTLGQEQNLPLTARIPQPSIHAAPGVVFTEVTRIARLDRFRLVSGTPAKDYLIEAIGAGCAFVDYDNDGWLDIYLVNSSTLQALRGQATHPRAALYRNNRDGTFTDVTENAGVANERWGQGVCSGDFDNDGWEDIYVTNFGGNRLYHNNRNGTFTDIAMKAGVTLGGWSAGCAFGDYDNDGRLDLFVAGYVEFDIDNLPPRASGEPDKSGAVPEQNRKTGGVGAAYVAGMNSCQFRGQRVSCGPLGLKGAADHLFHNNGDGTFTEVSERAGVSDRAGYYGLGVAWFDFDDDGRLDLLVANDSTPNYLYRNKGEGTFEDVSYLSGVSLNENGRAQACMGVSVGDYDGDGRADIHMTNFSDDSNVLYHNDGGGLFSETTFHAGIGEVTIPFLGWGTNFFDYDNDGFRDLLVANGHVYPVVDRSNWGTTYKQRLLLFRNLKGTFFEVGSSAGAALNTARSARGSATGDFDNDGDLDILLSNLDDSPSLLRNDGGGKAGHWLTLRLIGNPEKRCPRDAIGTVVFCTTQGRRLRGEVASGQGFYSQSDLRVHFGLGPTTKVTKLEVRWAGGQTETYEIEGVDRFLTIAQGKGLVR
ncbi:MAG: CRTAC1 family protein, partial [Acidobacteriota bacterium]